MLTSACFLLTLLTSPASGSPGKHDLYDVGGYCFTTLMFTVVFVFLSWEFLEIKLTRSGWMMDCFYYYISFKCLF